MPNFARGCPFTCRFCSQWKFWRKYRVRDPKKFADEIETLVRDFKVGFFILADEEPTIHRKKFVAFCEELIARKIKVHWGINTRVTDILRDRELLPLFRKAGLVHVSLGTEAAAQLKLDRFRKETTIEENKLAIRLLKEAGMVAEAQFIMGLENETRETIEETYRLAQDWKPDMANWNMYTPWPFAELFEELGDRVEVRDYAKYNFVTPIIQPDEMTREQVLKGVLKNYARFYMRKAFLEYPFIRDQFKRRYMMGCLKAFAKTTATKKFYDLERLKCNGLSRAGGLGLRREQGAEPRADRARCASSGPTWTPTSIPRHTAQGAGQGDGLRRCRAPRPQRPRRARTARRPQRHDRGARRARIGPNAIIQVAGALGARTGARAARASSCGAAGLGAYVDCAAARDGRRAGGDRAACGGARAAAGTQGGKRGVGTARPRHRPITCSRTAYPRAAQALLRRAARAAREPAAARGDPPPRVDLCRQRPISARAPGAPC